MTELTVMEEVAAGDQSPPWAIAPAALPVTPLVIYTDGACVPNPGAGGWGWHRSDGAQACGGDRVTTNNRMEMTAILRAMEALPDGATATINSDSQYCVKGLNVWSGRWAKRGWTMKEGKPVLNVDLWHALVEQRARLQVRFAWVRGHAGDAGNERADSLAATGRELALLA